jgi:hypothetical protein
VNKISEIGDGFEKLPAVLAEYDQALGYSTEEIKIKGKTIEQANMENPTHQSFYDQKRIELKTLTDYINMDVQRIRGKLFKQFKETHSRELNEREINQYINNENAYLTKFQLYLEVKEMYNKYQSVVEAFTARGYALNNITKVRVAMIESDIL